MSPKALVLTLAGAGCLAAAAGAAYWAPRHAVGVSRAAPASAPVATPAAPAVAAADAPVAAARPDHPAPVTASESATAPKPTQPKPPIESAAKSEDDQSRPASIEPEPAPPVAVVPPATAATPPIVATSTPVSDPVPPPPDPDPGPARRAIDTITVKEDSVIGIRLDQTISTETARVEDRVTARVTRDVRVGGRTAIPEGATLEGNVTLVERGGRFHENARLGVKFTTLVLVDRTRVPLVTDTIYRVGESASNEATSKIGASAVLGAILGGVIGGKRGAAIGGTAGAAGGAAAVAAGGTNDAVLPAGLSLTVRLSQAVALDVDRQ